MTERFGVHGWSTGKGGVPYFRLSEPLRVIASRGVHISYGPQLDDEILSKVDTVVADKLWHPAASVGWQQLAKLGTHRLVIDCDDWVWGPDWKPMQEAWHPEALGQLFRNVQVAHVVTTTTPQIAEYLAKLNRNVWIVPNTVPERILADDNRFDDAVSAEAPSIVYEGSPSHTRDWSNSSAGKHLYWFLREHPDWMVNWFGSIPEGLPEAFPGRIALHGWRSEVDDHFAALAAATVPGDVMIGPLRDTPFNRAKSGLRAQVASALGIIPVLPDMPNYRPFVQDGVTGRLIRSGQTMRRVLAEVAKEPSWRTAAAAAARTAAKAWTTENAIGAWIEAWNSR